MSLLSCTFSRYICRSYICEWVAAGMKAAGMQSSSIACRIFSKYVLRNTVVWKGLASVLGRRIYFLLAFRGVGALRVWPLRPEMLTALLLRLCSAGRPGPWHPSRQVSWRVPPGGPRLEAAHELASRYMFWREASMRGSGFFVRVSESAETC